MKILLISPLVKSINPDTKYAGIEKLVWEYAKELSNSNNVNVWGRDDSTYPDGVTVYPTKVFEEPFIMAELRQYQEQGYTLRSYDVVHDFSHQHFASRYNHKLKSLSLFWHAPATGRIPKSPYNIIAPSEWACREFQRVYRQQARYVQSIVVDGEVYKPGGKRGDRFVTMGIMTPDKGNLSAITLCKELGLPLDVVGARGKDKDAPMDDYERAIHSFCDGKQIRYLGEVSHEEKLKIMQECRALIYVQRTGEVTSHKTQEFMLCGAPVICSTAGALPEIVTHGVDGYLCSSEEEFKRALKDVDNLTPEKKMEETREKYSVRTVTSEYLKLYQEVAGGRSW
uniref:Putative glycosyltransferase n=1 Tax=viral metagenome TaxID=1070528 RepID=A0A6M3L7L9_9ZZZZ